MADLRLVLSMSIPSDIFRQSALGIMLFNAPGQPRPHETALDVGVKAGGDEIDPLVVHLMMIQLHGKVFVRGIHEETTVDAMDGDAGGAIGKNGFGGVNDGAYMTLDPDFLASFADRGIAHHFIFQHPSAGYPELSLRRRILAANQ